MTKIRTLVASRSFTLADQHEFARISADFNPMHIDEIAARRTQAGAPVVHGVHGAIWALDALQAAGRPIARATQLNVRFLKFMYLATPLDLVVAHESADEIKAEITADGQSLLSLTLRLAAGRPAGGGAVSPDAAEVTTAGQAPNTPQVEALANLTGWLTPPVPDEAWARLFPNATGALGAERLAALAQLSRLVGMIAPGLHSIFSAFTVDLIADTQQRRGLGFTVTTADARYRIVKMDVAGSGIAGNVSAFVRMAPVDTPALALLSRHVSAAEFAGSTSLVVGGSRGLGALTAKLLAAGGGKVLVTYTHGKAEAESLAHEIDTVCGAGVCTPFALDARRNIASQLGGRGDVSHLYYFATPQIFRQKSAVFSPAVYEDFSRFYVTAFHEAVEALMPAGRTQALSVFYPSSVAVETRPAGMTEYAMAKAAGELLCADLAKSRAQLEIVVARLPRLNTDQTATVAAVETADAVAVMLPLIRRVQAAGASLAPA